MGELERVGGEIARVVADSQALELLTETLRATQSSAHTVVPPTIVRTARPVSSHPANGVFFPFERNDCGSIRNGRSRFRSVTSAREPGRERSPFDFQDSGGPRGQKLDQPAEGDDSRTHQPIEAKRDRGFEPHDPEGGGVEVVVFLILVVRGVVGGDRVHGAVSQAFEERLPVLLGRERRLHLGLGVVARDAFVGEKKMMGRDLTGDRKAASFCLAHGPESARGREMGDVKPGAGELREPNVARDCDLFRRPGNPAKPEGRGPVAFVHDSARMELEGLAVLDDRDSEQFCVLHRAHA